MPELPEVETTLRGIEAFVDGKSLTKVTVRNSSLRWPVPSQKLENLCAQTVQRIERRAKYILIHLETACILLHLGMSGSLRVLDADEPAGKHDHVDLEFDTHHVIRLNDPRRFGCCLVLPLVSGNVEICERSEQVRRGTKTTIPMAINR